LVSPIKEERRYAPFKKEMGDILEEELQNPSRMISDRRLQSHINLVRSEDPNILGKLYLHSEQSIWHCVKDEIRTFREKQKKKSNSNIKNLLAKDQKDPIDHVVLDICTFYDVCWCCGDTITSCSHTLNLGAKVLVRATGCEAYNDQPLDKTVGPLRDHRSEFQGYIAGAAYELVPTFRPYIAHATVGDFL
jgi:hypothetical protein